MLQTVPPVEVNVTLGLVPAAAFDAFLTGFSAWWPPEHTYCGAAMLQAISLGDDVGDFCHELGPGGFRIDWGRLVEVKRASRLVFLWQIDPDRIPQPDPGKASEVQVLFTPEPGGRTHVRLIHRHFERHGEAGPVYRDQMASAEGWPLIMARFIDHASSL